MPVWWSSTACGKGTSRLATPTADRGGAYLLPQTELSPARLAGIISSLDRGRLLQMADNARALAKPLAAVAVAHACAELAGGDAT